MAHRNVHEARALEAFSALDRRLPETVRLVFGEGSATLLAHQQPASTTFTRVVPSDYGTRLVSVFEGRMLVVDARGATDLLVMKCIAGRDTDRAHAVRTAKVELSRLGTSAQGAYRDWPYDLREPEDLVSLCPEFARYDQRLLGVVVELFLGHHDIRPGTKLARARSGRSHAAYSRWAFVRVERPTADTVRKTTVGRFGAEIAAGARRGSRAGAYCAASMSPPRLLVRSRRTVGILGALASLCISGCGGSLRVGVPATLPARSLSITEEDGTRCIRARAGADSPYRESLPLAEDDPALLPYLEPLPRNVRRTAVAAGLEPTLARVLRAHAESRGEPTLALLELRQQLAERIAALQPQMLSSEFECECVGALLADALAEHEDSAGERQLGMTVASLVAGAGFSLAAGAWDLANNHTASPRAPDGPLVTAITGAVVTTGFGAIAMVPPSRPIAIEHDHNLLAPIVHGADPEGLYPTFVFRMLTLPTTDGEPTPRERLLARWDELLRAAVGEDDRSLVESLVFGSGGIYDDDVARLRRAMLAELETTLDSLAQHVDELGHEFSEALDR